MDNGRNISQKLVAYYHLTVGAIVICFLITTPLSAQTTEDNVQVWFDYFHHHRINHRLRYFSDNGYRTTIPSINFHRIYTRPTLEYQFNGYFRMFGGVGLFYTFRRSEFNRLEIRPWLGARVYWPQIGRVAFDHYLRTEWRNTLDFDDGAKSSIIRPRFRSRVTVPFNHPKIQDETWYGKASIELFQKAGKEVEERYSDRYRIEGGIGYALTKNDRFEVYYGLQRSRNTTSGDFNKINHFFKIRFIQRFNYN